MRQTSAFFFMGRRRVLLRVLACAALPMVGFVASEAPARACSNAVHLSADSRITRLQKAETALDEGELDRASELAREVVGHRGKAEPGWDTPDDRLTQRAYRVLALAYVRDPGGHDSVGFDVPSALVERRRGRHFSGSNAARSLSGSGSCSRSPSRSSRCSACSPHSPSSAA